MILVDTSVWIDHLHRAEPGLVGILDEGLVATHPVVIGELALGSLHARRQVIGLLTALPHVTTSSHDECLHLVKARGLHGRGLSLVDAHLLTSARLTPETTIWTQGQAPGHGGDRAVAGVAAGLTTIPGWTHRGARS